MIFVIRNKGNLEEEAISKKWDALYQGIHTHKLSALFYNVIFCARRLDVVLINWLQSTFGAGSRPFFDFFSACGGPRHWQVVLPLVFWLAGSKVGLRVAFPTAIAGIFTWVLKWSFVHPRPYYVSDEIQAMRAGGGLGMPSGHAQSVAAQWGAIAYFVRKRWCLFLGAVVILFTGVARIYYGVHTPIQVAVGWSFGLLAVVVAAWLEGPVVRWCRRKSVTAQVAAAFTIAALVVVLGYGISTVAERNSPGDLQWQTRWQATFERLRQEDNTKAANAEFRLIRSSDILGPTCHLFGCAICGIWLLRIGGRVTADFVR